MTKFLRQQSGTKNCSKCYLEQNVNNFYSDKNNKDGLKSECKICHKKERDNRRSIDIIGRLLTNAKSSSSQKETIFELTRNDIVIPDNCPILNIKLSINNIKNYLPSIDRINSNIGYIKNNIIVCSWRANRLKGNANLDEIYQIYNNWQKFNVTDELLLNNHNYYLNRMLIHCRERCKKKNIFYDLNIDDLKIPKICPILGLELAVGKKNFCDQSPSLDRIDINLGYFSENVRIISWKANKLKSDATYLEYERIYNFYKGLM